MATTTRTEWEALCAAFRAAFTEQNRCATHTDDIRDATMTACHDAFWLVREYPVTSIAMLNEKAAIMTEYYYGELEGHDAERLMLDIASLAKMEG